MKKNEHTQIPEMIIKGGLMAALLAMALPDLAFAAADNLGESVNHLTEGMTNMPVVISGIAYLAGGATMMHGCGLLKKHADQPTGTPLMAGLTRLMAGGCVAALPFAMEWAVNSFDWKAASGDSRPWIALPTNAGNFGY